MLAPMVVRAAVLALLIVIAGGLASRRVAREGTEVLGQRKLFQRALPGLMHALIFWGFLILLTTIVEVAGELIDPTFELPVIGGTRWLGLIQDVFAGGVLVGIAIAVGIRVFQRPERFVGSHRWEAYRIFGLIFLIIVTLFLARGARIAAGYAPDWWWTPLSTATSSLFTWMSDGWQRASMRTLQWVHVAIILAFLVYLGYSKHLHIA